MQGEEEECVFLLMECLRATIEGVVVCLSIHVCMYLSICLFVCLYLFIPLMVLPFCLSVCLIVFYFAALPPPANTQNGRVFREAGGTKCVLRMVNYKKPRRMALRLVL